ncbi:MAG: dTDP-4-dehydrorhamnose 3,5-epimerase [Pseudomonadota bacterium]
MDIQTFELPGVLRITPRRFGDDRGFFSETYNRQRWQEHGLNVDFVQDNLAYSSVVDTIRGLHFQGPPDAQNKLISVLRGAIVDVALDIRAGSPGYGRSVSALLTAEGGEQLLIPSGFAHAYRTVTPDCLVTYKVDAHYAPASEGGVRWDDPALKIDWTAGGSAPPIDRPTISERDGDWPTWGAFESPFAFTDA